MTPTQHSSSGKPVSDAPTHNTAAHSAPVPAPAPTHSTGTKPATHTAPAAHAAPAHAAPKTAKPAPIQNQKAKPKVKAVQRNAPAPRPTRYVDATNLIVGRMASLVAQDLLRGENVTLVNVENAVFTGNPRVLTQLWQTRLDLRPKGNPEFGPRFSKMPDRIVREIIEGMVPFKRQRGIDAMKRLRVYIGIPMKIKDKKFGTLEAAKNTKMKGIQTVRALAESIGYTLLNETQASAKTPAAGKSTQ